MRESTCDNGRSGGAGAVLDEGEGGAVHLRDEVALAHGPAGRGATAVDGKGREGGSHVVLSLIARRGGAAIEVK